MNEQGVRDFIRKAVFFYYSETLYKIQNNMNSALKKDKFEIRNQLAVQGDELTLLYKSACELLDKLAEENEIFWRDKN